MPDACASSRAYWLTRTTLLPAAALVPPDVIPAAVRTSFDRTDRALLADRRPWASVEEMAAYRGRNNPRLPPEWALHLARHGAREVEGGWVWKADPMFGVGTVMSVEELDDDVKVVVKFGSVGQKTLRARYAKLELA